MSRDRWGHSDERAGRVERKTELNDEDGLYYSGQFVARNVEDAAETSGFLWWRVCHRSTRAKINKVQREGYAQMPAR